MAIDERPHVPYPLVRSSLQESISALRVISHRSQSNSKRSKERQDNGGASAVLHTEGCGAGADSEEADVSRAAQTAIDLMK